MADTEQPLVSIMHFCKDRVHSIQRSIDSVLGQSYPNIELVIQDGVSTDGTLEVIRSYQDDRIKLLSEPDAGTGDAHWKALRRCQGEILGTCLSDDELLPGAIETAVARFQAEPDVGAITGDSYFCDINGNIIGAHISSGFDLVRFLFAGYCPFFPATFFRRKAFLDVGLETREWVPDTLELEIWFRFGTENRIRYYPGFVSKYAIHAQQSTHRLVDVDRNLNGWFRLLEKWFSAGGFFGPDTIKKNACIYNTLYVQYNHFFCNNVAELAEEFYGRARRFSTEVRHAYRQLERSHRGTPLVDSIGLFDYWQSQEGPLGMEPPAAAERGGGVETAGTVAEHHSPSSLEDSEERAADLGVPPAQRAGFAELRAKRFWPSLTPELAELYWFRLAAGTPAFVRTLVPAGVRRRAKRALLRWASGAHRDGFDTSEPVPAVINTSVPRLQPLSFSTKVYAEIAELYAARGQISAALEMWSCAEELGDAQIDGVACQAALKLPGVSQEQLLARQQRWAKRHALPQDVPLPHLVPPREGRRIRVAYHCVFTHSDLFHVMMGATIANHDRSKFVVHGYAPLDPPAYIKDVFDSFQNTGALSDYEFVQRIRADRIDILVEVSGFSTRHRFAAMATRCAPVQVSYLNHTGTCGVPNVDYVFADDISVSMADERFFTEKVWRLPGCFLCYNYDAMQLPPIGMVPAVKNGYITFGCFGSGGKINDQLIAIWARLLNQIPHSKLYLRNLELSADDNRRFMIDRFRSHDIGEDRLKVLGGADRDTILKCYDEIDISLDTWPYCGGNTIAESLGQGVPVITLLGDRFAGRYGASLLHAAGCPELVAGDVEEYIKKAAELGAAPDRLRFYRENLRQMVREHGLSDARRFSLKLEEAYVSMFRVARPEWSGDRH